MVKSLHRVLDMLNGKERRGACKNTGAPYCSFDIDCTKYESYAATGSPNQGTAADAKATVVICYPM